MFTQEAGYVDARYLERLAEAMRPVKVCAYERLAPSAGMKILDAGCGPGIDTIALARAVGPRGQVVGVDVDPEMVRTAQRRARDAGVSDWTVHRQADAETLVFADSHFDACRSERVFQHLPRPGDALAELLRVTRPGGRIVVVDTDHASLSFHCEDLSLERRFAAYLCRRLANGASGRSLRPLFVAKGVTKVTIDVFPIQVTDFALGNALLRLEAVLAESVRSGALSAADGERLRSSWDALQSRGEFFGCENMYVVAGVKA